jgi:hypothetical protein
LRGGEGQDCGGEGRGPTKWSFGPARKHGEWLGHLTLSVRLGASVQDAEKAEAGVTVCGIVCTGLVVAVCGGRRQLVQVVEVVWLCAMLTWCW